MKKMTTMFMLLSLFFVVGCGNSGAPDCSSKDVKNLVVDIVNVQIKNSIVNQMRLGGNPSYEDLKIYLEKYKKSGDIESVNHFKTTIETVDKQLASLSPSIEGVRTDGCDDKSRKCKCGANVVLSNGKSLPIQYTAQYTDDGKIYVEVSGL